MLKKTSAELNTEMSDTERNTIKQKVQNLFYQRLLDYNLYETERLTLAKNIGPGNRLTLLINKKLKNLPYKPYSQNKLDSILSEIKSLKVEHGGGEGNRDPEVGVANLQISVELSKQIDAVCKEINNGGRSV